MMPEAEVDSAGSLVDYLEMQGLDMREEGRVTQPAFTAVGQEYTISYDDRIQVYEYATVGEAEQEAMRLGVGSRSQGPRSIYQRDRLIVVYFGQDPDIRLRLSSVLGTQFV